MIHLVVVRGAARGALPEETTLAIEPSEVRHIAELAGLELEDSALDALATELGTIFEYVRALEGLEDAAPLGAAAALVPGAPLREDAVRDGAGSAAALANAAEGAAGHFRVPRVLRE